MDQCRFCGLEKDSMTSIFKEDLVENIKSYLHIQVSLYDMLPHSICSTCEDEIKRIVQFMHGCQKVQEQHLKRIFLENNKIPEQDIKLEDDPLTIETPPENYFPQEYKPEVPQEDRLEIPQEDKLETPQEDKREKPRGDKREKPRGNKREKPQGDKLEKPRGYKANDGILFSRNLPEIAPGKKGSSNTSILVQTNHGQFLELCSVGTENLKYFGRKVLYQRYWDAILEKRHLKLTFEEIHGTFVNFLKSLPGVSDPLVKLEPLDELEEERRLLDQVKVPTILVNPCPEMITPDTNYLEFGSDSSETSEPNGSESKMVKCTKCPFKTDRKFRLNQHNFEVHDKRFLCEPCGRRFGKKSKLLQHTQLYHTDLDPIVCSLCSLSFKQRFEYKKHLKSHSNGEGRSWRCDHCEESFNVQHKLDIHVSRFHRSKSVKCSRCSYVAAHKYQIKQHVREVHEKSIICDHCGKRESKKCRMIAHIQKKHMPKTEFVCNVCQARYFSKAWFEKHKREGCP